jgi:hypothetical protein
MNLHEALKASNVPFYLDSRANYRSRSEGENLTVITVSTDDSETALSKALHSALALITASGQVLVLRAGTHGVIAVEAEEEPSAPQGAILVSISQACDTAYGARIAKYSEAPSGKKKPKADVVINVTEEVEPDADDPVFTSEPITDPEA